MKKGLRSIFLILLIIVFIAGCISANYWNETTQIHRVLSIDKIEAVEGTSDGFNTRVYYQVSTDKGAYHIRTVGLNAAPQCSGIKKDSVYRIVTRGVNIPIIGVYPCIIEIKENE